MARQRENPKPVELRLVLGLFEPRALPDEAFPERRTHLNGIDAKPFGKLMQQAFGYVTAREPFKLSCRMMSANSIEWVDLCPTNQSRTNSAVLQVPAPRALGGRGSRPWASRASALGTGKGTGRGTWKGHGGPSASLNAARIIWHLKKGHLQRLILRLVTP